MNRCFLKILMLVLFFSCQKENAKSNHMKPQTFEWLYFGEIKPKGWILEQMQNDLQQSFVGQLDELVPDLIKEDDIYGSDRLTKIVKSKDLGVENSDAEWEVQFLWWNSETQSNWRDGMVRTAILTEDTEYLQKVDQLVSRMLSYQDEDGYMGIYAPDLRYNFESENGELWAQASLFRFLLAYYEATGKESVLEAVEKAVAVTMKAYPIAESTPFKVTKPFAGVGHGLCFVDVLDRLYQLTDKKEYADYAVFLFEDYNQHELAEVDIQVENLLNPDYRFKGHGVHTYEHLRALVSAYYNSNDERLAKALEAYLGKLGSYLTPSGGPIGDEWITEREADAFHTGYEYCSIHELLDSYSQLLQKSGNGKWGDDMEWLLFNAGQAARHPHENSIAYLKTDNSYEMLGCLHQHEQTDSDNHQTRYKYSPAHQDVAVCCVPNAGRIYPYYVKAMWMKSDNGLAATAYGPCEVTTQIKGTKLNIVEESNYPFDLNTKFYITVDKPTQFELKFRKPAWAKQINCVASQVEISEDKEWIKLEKTWKTGDVIQLSFEAEVQEHQHLNGEYYISRGPLIYALPLKSEEKEIKTYPLKGFRDLHYTLKDENPDAWRYQPETFKLFDFTASENNQKNYWNTLNIKGKLIKNTQEKEIELIPMGNTLLRKITFEKANK